MLNQMKRKSIDNFFKILAVYCLALLSASCSTTEQTFWEHIPSKMFFEKYDYQLHELDPFRSVSVLIVVEIKEVTHKSSRLGVSLYSSERKSIILNNVKVVDAGGGLLLENHMDTELTALKQKGNLFYSDLNALEFETARLAQAKISGKPINLIIAFAQEGEVREMSFILFPRSVRWDPWPT